MLRTRTIASGIGWTTLVSVVLLAGLWTAGCGTTETKEAQEAAAPEESRGRESEPPLVERHDYAKDQFAAAPTPVEPRKAAGRRASGQVAPPGPVSTPSPVADLSKTGRETGVAGEQVRALRAKPAPGKNDISLGLHGTVVARPVAMREPERRLPGRTDGDDAAGIRRQDGTFHTDAYDQIVENEFLAVADKPLSTFSIDVDTASYANVRRMLTAGQLPPAGAVRIEEMVNYFRYGYQAPADSETPFAVHSAIATCPWEPKHLLARIALKGKDIDMSKRPATNLTFLLDVSGSMNSANKLPLVKDAMTMLTKQLGENDRIAIVVYAGAAGVVLEPTQGDQQETILAALRKLHAGGSTNGGQGISMAYTLAMKNFIEGGVNRVILCTDGDFNVGVTSQSELVKMIEDRADQGVFLTILGFGMGNYKDSTLEKLADKGDGNYGYIDTKDEARKVFVEQASGTLLTIAKDVKIQVEFNPARVAGYRLIGYENRALADRDFNDDTKDAGEIGAGHTVTALYELVPAGEEMPKGVDALKYQKPANLTDAADSDEWLTVKLRHKAPEGGASKLRELPLTGEVGQLSASDDDFQFAAAVAAFGMLLRDSKHAGNASLAWVIETAEAAGKSGVDAERRAEFVKLARKADALRKQHAKAE